MNADMYSGTVGLFSSDFVDVNNKLLSINAHDTSGIPLVVASGDRHLIVYSAMNGSQEIVSCKQTVPS